MIELQKYSKVDADPFMLTVNRHQDRHNRLINYSVAAFLGATVLVSLQICYTNVDSRELNMELFESDANSETMKAYINFLAEAKKTYVDRQTQADRYRNFKANYEMIKKHNLYADSLPFEMELNHFADMSKDEFVTQHRLRVPQHLSVQEDPVLARGHSRQGVDRFDKPSVELPQVKSWVEEGAVSLPYDQRQCGSCWAFSTASTLESLAVISGHFETPTEFSVQQLVDCDSTNNGCDGGWMFKGYKYTSKFGMMHKDSYPYISKEGKCKYDKDLVIFKNLGMVQESPLSNNRLKELVNKQPVAVGINANDNLRFYKSGVLTEDFLKCSDPSEPVNHGVVVVGFGKVARGEKGAGFCKEYWLVRNTWGTNWGDKGFFKLCMDGAGSDEVPYGICQINRYPTYPTMD